MPWFCFAMDILEGGCRELSLWQVWRVFCAVPVVMPSIQIQSANPVPETRSPIRSNRATPCGVRSAWRRAALTGVVGKTIQMPQLPNGNRALQTGSFLVRQLISQGGKGQGPVFRLIRQESARMQKLSIASARLMRGNYCCAGRDRESLSYANPLNIFN